MYFDQVKFGNRLRNLRKQRGKTQEQLAAAVNIGTVHLGNIELGKRGLSIDLMIELSNVLNVSLDYLMLGIHYGRKPIRPENCPIEPKRIKENWSSIFCPIHICPSLTGKPS